MGALANEFTNPGLARILEQLCEENGLLEGDEGKILRQNLIDAGIMWSHVSDPPTGKGP